MCSLVAYPREFKVWFSCCLLEVLFDLIIKLISSFLLDLKLNIFVNCFILLKLCQKFIQYNIQVKVFKVRGGCYDKRSAKLCSIVMFNKSIS